jgi:hypothetical protein
MTARAALLVFDDYIPAGTCGGVYAYTPDVLNDFLGSYDVIAYEVVVCDVTVAGAGSLSLYLQHSADNRSFVYSSFATTPPASPDIYLSPLSTTAVSHGISAYQGAYPLLGNVRFALQFGEPTTSAHVKLFAVQRDLS